MKYDLVNFRILRYVVAELFAMNLFLLWLLLFPFVLPISVWQGVFRDNWGGVWPIYFGVSCYMSLVVFIPCIVIGVCEKRRIPLTFEFSRGSVLISNTRGRRTRVPVSMCVYTENLFYCFFNSLFKGTWRRGVTIYVPKKELRNIPLGFWGWGDFPFYLGFHLSMNDAERRKLIDLLNSLQCRRIQRQPYDLFWIVFGPSIFLWGDIIVALLLSVLLGPLGPLVFLCCGICGFALGMAFALTKVDISNCKPPKTFQWRIKFAAKLFSIAPFVCSLFFLFTPEFLVALSCAFICFFHVLVATCLFRGMVVQEP